MTSELSTLLQFILTLFMGATGGLLAFWSKFAKYEEKVDSIKEILLDMSIRLRDTERKVTTCETRLEERDLLINFVNRQSPLSLTEQGNILLKKAGGKEIVDANKEELISKIKKSNPASPYDVQEISKQIIADLKDESRFVAIKDFAFKKGLDLDIPITIMGIYLRDLALPIYGWEVRDIKE